MQLFRAAETAAQPLQDVKPAARAFQAVTLPCRPSTIQPRCTAVQVAKPAALLLGGL